MEQIFLRQFVQEDEGLVYRKNGNGPPIPVSSDERDEFLLEYRKASRWLIWGGALIVILTITIGILIDPAFVDEGWGQYLIIGGTIVVTALLSVRNSTAPARALENRSPVGEPLSRQEWEARHFAATGWPRLVVVFVISTGIWVSLFVHSEFEALSDYLWAGGSLAMSSLGARALWLKYNYARSPLK